MKARVHRKTTAAVYFTGMLCVVAAQAAGAIHWPDEWTVFGPVPPSAVMGTVGSTPNPGDLVDGDRLKVIPAELTIGEHPYAAVHIKRSVDTLDLGELFGEFERGDMAYLMAEISVDQAGEYAVYCGANWWMHWWLNGERVFTTIPEGNAVAPVAMDNHRFMVELDPGDHVLAVAVIGGSGGFSFAAGGAREVEAAKAAAAKEKKESGFQSAFDRAWDGVLGRRAPGGPMAARMDGPGPDFAAARGEFTEALALAGDDRERARARLARTECMLRDLEWIEWAETETEYRAVLDSDAPSDLRARAAIGLGEARLRRNDYAQARAAFTRAREIDDTPGMHAKSQFAFARSFMQERDYGAALLAFETLRDMEAAPDAMRRQAHAHRTGITLLARLRADRPRMFFNAQTWPAIKARAMGTRAEEFAALRVQVSAVNVDEIRPGDWGDQAMRAALVWRVSGDEEALEITRRMLRATLTGWMRGAGDSRYYSRASFAAALDWVWDDLPPSERLELTQAFIDYGYTLYQRLEMGGSLDNLGYYYLYNMMWYAGLAAMDPDLTDSHHARAVALLGQGYVNNLRMWEGYPKQAMDDGGSGAFAVGRLIYEYAETPTPVWTFLHCLNSALGEDVPAAWAYLGITPHHVLRNLLDIIGHRIRIFGFSRCWRWKDGATGAGLLYDHLGQFIHFHADTHPKEAGIARHLRERLEQEGRVGAGRFEIYPFLLNLDDAPAAGIPENMPLARHFESRGKLFMSSGFEPGDTYILFSAGGGTSDWGAHNDVGHFTIYRQGFLALDAGSRAHPGYYVYNTVAHNSVLVRNPNRTVLVGGEDIPHTGGQDRHRAFATVLAFESSPAFAYMATDATPTYQEDDCAQVVRQFVYLPPDHVVVFDRVTATHAEYPKTWLFQTANEPEIRGREFSAVQHRGKIFCRTLYPADAVLEPVGGPGKEFWASGRNWPIPETSPHRSRLLEADGTVPEIHGRWRIEVQPGAAREEDHFLHLIQTATPDTNGMVESELVDADEALEIRFSANGRDYTLRFNKTGDVGGWIRIEESGRADVDRPLTETIMAQSGLALEGEPPQVSEHAIAVTGEALRTPDVLDAVQHDPRSTEAVRLTAAHAASVPRLIESLSDPQPGVRRRAAWALGRIGDSRAVPALSLLLSDEIKSVRSAAVDALAAIARATGDPESLAALIRSLADPDAWMRGLAVNALSRTGAESVVGALERRLIEDGDVSVRAAAAAALEVLPAESAVDTLAQAARDANGRVRRQAFAALAAQGSAAVPALIEMLGGETGEAALSEAALSTMGHPAFEPLLAALGAEDPYVRGRAASALRIPDGDDRAKPVLLNLAGDREPFVRALAVRALSRLEGADIQEVLLGALDDKDPTIRAAAAVALGGRPDDSVIRSLIEALADSDASVRASAAMGLGESGASKALEPLVQALEDSDREVRIAAATALGRLGDGHAVHPLVDALNDDESGVGYAANDALFQITGHRVDIPHGWSGALIRQHRRPHWLQWLDTQENE